MQADGGKENTGWITPDEGFLVEIQNDNGTIDSVAQMFSTKTSPTANTGFGALSELDTNHDGKIDKSDNDWSKLQVWVDKNSDGVSQKDELLTLNQLGIDSINLNTTELDKQDNGNVILGDSTFTRIDGSKGDISEVSFQYDGLTNGNFWNGLSSGEKPAVLTGSANTGLNQLIQAMATFDAGAGGAITSYLPHAAAAIAGTSLVSPLSIHR